MLTFIIFFSGAGFPEPAGQERTIVRLQVRTRRGGEEGTIVRYLQEKIGGRTPDPIPEQLQKKE
jgi:hypothetical protein